MLTALPGNSFTFVRPPDLALRHYLIGEDSSSTHVAVWIMNVSGQPITFDVFYPGDVEGWRVNGRR